MRRGIFAATVSSFSPLELPGLLAWYDAGDASTITNPGAVTEWRDKSGNGRHMTPGAIAAVGTPSVAAAYVNGKDAMFFSGDTYFKMPERLTTVRCVLMHAKWADGTGEYRVIIGDGDFWTNQSNADFWLGAAEFQNQLFSEYTNPAVLNGDKYVNGVLMPGAGTTAQKTLERYTSWTQHQFNTTANANVWNLASDRPADEAVDGWSPRQFKGHMAEVAILSAIPSDALRLKWEEYITKKWGATTTVDEFTTMSAGWATEGVLTNFNKTAISGIGKFQRTTDNGGNSTGSAAVITREILSGEVWVARVRITGGYCGLFIGNSTTKASVMFSAAPATQYTYQRLTTDLGFVANMAGSSVGHSSWFYQRVRRDGNNIYFAASNDAVTWTEYGPEDLTAHVGNPNQIGFGVRHTAGIIEVDWLRCTEP